VLGLGGVDLCDEFFELVEGEGFVELDVDVGGRRGVVAALGG
jgi:hypothetical protein